jgi:hypothetical protein
MFKWDRLLRKNKLPRNLDNMEDVAEDYNVAASSDNSGSEWDDEHKAEEEYEIVEMEILPAKIICPDCGGITLEGLEFCDKCGGEL